MVSVATTSIRAVTYNIHRCIDSRGKTDADKIATVINGLQPEIIALQEVVSNLRQDGGMLGYLARKTGMRSIPGLTMLEDEGHYGNALLTRIPADNIQRYDISVSGREPRGILTATLSVDEKKLHVFATHLGLRQKERRYQIQQLAQCIEPVKDQACLVMGDMNEWNRFSRNFRLLTSLLGKGSLLATFPAKRPLFPLDQIMATPSCQIDSLQVIKDSLSRTASDHLPLLATISL